MGRGIDYGRGITNIDTENGIRYGVIPANDVADAWFDSAERDYGDPTCPVCEEIALKASDPLADPDADAWEGRGCADYFCERCKHTLDVDDVFPEEPFSFRLADGETKATQGADDHDVFVLKSPYFTRAAFCSPCAPGACYLRSPSEDGERAYCFGHDWFEKGVAPYPVFLVKTGEPVPPKEEAEG